MKQTSRKRNGREAIQNNFSSNFFQTEQSEDWHERSECLVNKVRTGMNE